jgi:signal transduction histidine kinase
VWWLLQGKPAAPEDWENDARLFVTARAGLERVVWLDQRGARSWALRPGGRPEMGVARQIDAALMGALETARDRNGIAVSPVFEADGKRLFYACTPIRSRDYRHLLGYIAGQYDASALIGSLLRGQLPDLYIISVTADGHTFRVPQGAAGNGTPEFSSNAPVPVANSAWLVTLAPEPDNLSPIRQPVMMFGVALSAVLYLCAAVARLARRRAKDFARVNEQLVVENQERRRAEEQVAQLNRDLQRRLEEFKTLIEVLPVGIAVAEDPECRNIWTNRALATLVGVEYGENVSASPARPDKPHYRMLRNGVETRPDDLPMQIAARTGTPVVNYYLDIAREDGKVAHTLSYSAPLFDENMKVRGVINACVDITERKLLEDRVQQSEKYRSLALMAGGIAHDFNNLLTVVIGNASAAAMEVPERSAPGRAIAEVQAAAARAAGLVSQLLAFTGRFWYQLQPLGLSSVIGDMIPELRGAAPAAVTISFDLATELPLIEAGDAEVRQVVTSLVANAVESLDEGMPGEIEVRTSRCELSDRDIEIFYPDLQLTPGIYVRLEVADNGCGIPDEILARVFDPFFTTKFVGRGLGLSAVQGIVRAHGGAVRLTSALHHGTRVEVVFPAYAAADQVVEPRREVLG